MCNILTNTMPSFVFLPKTFEDFGNIWWVYTFIYLEASGGDTRLSL